MGIDPFDKEVKLEFSLSEALVMARVRQLNLALRALSAPDAARDFALPSAEPLQTAEAETPCFCPCCE